MTGEPIVRIELWSVEYRGTPYMPPEWQRRCLAGIVYGHPIKRDGTEVITSPMLSVQGRRVTTESGTVYELGEPSLEYLEWLKEEGIAFDPEEPIKKPKRR